jgi:hypothetical protein
VKGELGGAPDDLDGLPRLLQAGQFHDDALLTGADQGRLGHTKYVHPATKYLQRPISRLRVGLHHRGVVGFQYHLSAVAKIQAQGRHRGQHGCGRAGQHDQRQHNTEHQRPVAVARRLPRRWESMSTGISEVGYRTRSTFRLSAAGPREGWSQLSIRPVRIAYRVSSVRSRISNFCRMFARCRSTVLTLITSSAAISLDDRPSAISLTISDSLR